VHGINKPDSSELLEIPLGTLKLMQCDIFSVLKTKLSLRFDVDHRALILASREGGILTPENSKLPKEVMDWIVKNKAMKV